MFHCGTSPNLSFQHLDSTVLHARALHIYGLYLVLVHIQSIDPSPHLRLSLSLSLPFFPCVHTRVRYIVFPTAAKTAPQMSPTPTLQGARLRTVL